jgi:hypothetical protein
MQNHYSALSATLAEQHRDDLCHQAEQVRLVRGGRAARERVGMPAIGGGGWPRERPAPEEPGQAFAAISLP